MYSAICVLALIICAVEGFDFSAPRFRVSPDNVQAVGCYPGDLLGGGNNMKNPTWSKEYDLRCFKMCIYLMRPYVGVKNNHEVCYCSITNLDFFHDSERRPPKCVNCFNPCEPGDLAFYKLNKKQEEVSILIGTDSDVQKLNVTSFKTEVLTQLGSPVEAIDYHYELGEAFVLTNESIFRFPLALNQTVNSSSPPAETSIYANCGTFTVDWVHGHIIWPICHHLAVIQIATLNGRDDQWTLLVLPKWHPAHVVDIVVDPYASQLFWTTRHALVSCGLDGRNLRIVTKTLPAFVTSMALDLVLRRIYLTGHSDNYSMIFFTDYEGRTVETVQNISRQEEEIWTVDVFRSQVYFLTHIPDNRSLIYQIQHNGRTTSKNKVFSQTEELFYMKLMHPELQTLPATRVDVCTNRGCAHHCVVEQQLARCRCVRGFTLVDNDTHCQEIPNGPSSVDVATMGVVVVLFIILAAIVLMGMVDKLWSKVHPRIVLIYRRPIPQRPQSNDQVQDQNP